MTVVQAVNYHCAEEASYEDCQKCDLSQECNEHPLHKDTPTSHQERHPGAC